MKNDIYLDSYIHISNNISMQQTHIYIQIIFLIDLKNININILFTNILFYFLIFNLISFKLHTSFKLKISLIKIYNLNLKNQKQSKLTLVISIVTL